MTMGPTAIAALLFLALVIDYLSVGPNSLRDRVAFLLGLAAIRQGFDGSPLDRWTVEQLGTVIGTLKGMAGGAKIAGASTEGLIGVFVGVLFIYTVGCLLPVNASKRFGKFAALTFPVGGKINWKLWLCAALLGMLADLPGGLIGVAVRWFVDTITALVAPLPALLFGVV
jgi:hypothetical protein